MKYFAYGSNISINRMVNERKINYISRELAILENYKLVFNKISKKNNKLGFANIIESDGDFVEGVLYELNYNDLNIIDKFEGANTNPKHYYQKIITVINNNIPVQAITYIANPLMLNNDIKPNKQYLNYILDGKDVFSNEYYTYLKSIITID